ncbi:MAG: hypothetical protein WCF08_05820, partial [Anaerolineaceae bacterium]
MSKFEKVPGSFRDPNGFLFTHGDILYRQVNKLYGEHYDHLITSGLYPQLVKAGLLIEHVEVDETPVDQIKAYKVLRPERVSFISFPYEWCFSQYRDAALCTLTIM